MTFPTRLALPLSLAAAITGAAPPACAADGAFIRDENGCRFANPSPKPNERVTWSGECRDGWGAGRGTLQWIVNGVPTYTYVGTVAAGKLEGEGTEDISGDRYVGHFVDGHRQGHGTFTWHGGLRYEGDFVHGQMEGQGALSVGLDVRFEGRFANNLLQAPATMVKTAADGAQLRIPIDFPDANDPPPTPVASAASAVNAVRIRFESRCAPKYPQPAIAQAATGTTRLSMRVEPDATVSRMRLDRRSGSDFAHQLLDLSALAGLVDCPYDLAGPATTAQWTRIDYAWKLE